MDLYKNGDTEEELGQKDGNDDDDNGWTEVKSRSHKGVHDSLVKSRSHKGVYGSLVKSRSHKGV